VEFKQQCSPQDVPNTSAPRQRPSPRRGEALGSGGHVARALARMNVQEGDRASGTPRRESSNSKAGLASVGQDLPRSSENCATSSPRMETQTPSPGRAAAASIVEHGVHVEQDMTAITLADAISEVAFDTDAGRLPPDTAGEPYRWIRDAAGQRERGLRMEAAAVTLAACRLGGYVLNGKRITLHGVADMVSETRIVLSEQIPHPGSINVHATATTWQKHPAGQAIRVAAIRAMSLQICLVNDASAYQLGGGFTVGERHGPEESLCMQSTVFPSLLVAQEQAQHRVSAHGWSGEGNTERYIPQNGVILSPSVELIRGDSLDGYPFEGKPICLAAVLSIAMPNNNPQLRNAPVDRPQALEAYRNLLRQKFIALLGAAQFVGAAGVVVPEVGCGAYLNRPTEVGRALGEVVRERFPSVFKEIHLVGGTEFCQAAEAAARGGDDMAGGTAMSRDTVHAAIRSIPLVAEVDRNPVASPASSAGFGPLPDSAQVLPSEPGPGHTTAQTPQEQQTRDSAGASANHAPAQGIAAPGIIGDGSGELSAATAASVAAAGTGPDVVDGIAASVALSLPGRVSQHPPGGSAPSTPQGPHIPVDQHSLQGVQTIDLFGGVIADPQRGPSAPHSGPPPLRQVHGPGMNSFVEAMGNHSWAGSPQQPEPLRGQIMFRDPRPSRAAGSTTGVVAFSKGERVEPWDKQCGASFLGNYYDLGPGGLHILVDSDSWFACCACCQELQCFRNASAAFEALKYWRAGRAHEFENLTGSQASDRSEQHAHSQDRTLAGFSHVFVAMMHVLRSKFFRGSPLAASLLKTEPDFLLYHDSLKGEDPVWSDDFDGSGTNWLGMQLMLIREELRFQADDSCPGEWTSFIESCMDTRTGAPLTARGAKTWQEAVQSAALAVRQAQAPVAQAMLPLPAVGFQSLTSFCEGLSCKKGEVCNLQ